MSEVRVSLQEIREALTDAELLGLTGWGEARGKGLQAQVDVMSVVHTRVRTPERFGRSYAVVCLTRGQFSCWWRWGGVPNYKAVMAEATALALRHDKEVSASVRESIYLAEGVIAGRVLDSVKGAEHFYAPKAMKPKGRVPSWAIGRRPVRVRLGHRFYRLVRKS